MSGFESYGFEGGLLLVMYDNMSKCLRTHGPQKFGSVLQQKKNQNLDLVSLTSDWMIQKVIF